MCFFLLVGCKSDHPISIVPIPDRGNPAVSASPVSTISSADDTISVSSLMEFKNASLSTIWPIYARLSGRELVIDSRAKMMGALITFKVDGMQTKDEVLKLMREAFLRQARIVITQLDEKRESVTLNDALPVTK